MSSKLCKPYLGPTDFRMMREILRRSGYRLADTDANRSAQLAAAKILIKEFQAGQAVSRIFARLSQRRLVQSTQT